jgi:hypothetical protein
MGADLVTVTDADRDALNALAATITEARDHLDAGELAALAGTLTALSRRANNLARNVRDHLGKGAG